MRVAIIHDYLAQAGGAERVVVAIHDVWQDAPIYTSIYDADATLSEFRDMDVRTSFLQRMPIARSAKTHKFVLPLYPAAFEHFDLSEFDLVISNSTGFAKGVITGPETCHICYCHTPARFAWRYHEYINQGGYGKLQRNVLPWVVHRLRSWDLQTADRVDYFVANSYNIAKRVHKIYRRESDILYPPVSTGRFHIAASPREDFLLVVSRLVGYKRVDLAVEACTKLGIPLKVVGGGPDLPRLKAMAGPNVEFMGRLPDKEVVELFANCRAFLFPGEEDFGIAPLEAMASGRPVVAYRAGGATETVVDGVTGLFFDKPTAESLIEALRRLDGLSIDVQQIRAHAETFDTARFQERLKTLVMARYADHLEFYGRMRPRGVRGGDAPHTAPVAPTNGTHGTTNGQGNGASVVSGRPVIITD